MKRDYIGRDYIERDYMKKDYTEKDYTERDYIGKDYIEERLYYTKRELGLYREGLFKHKQMSQPLI